MPHLLKGQQPAQLRIVRVLRQDSVHVGVQAGRDRMMVRERLCRENVPHVIRVGAVRAEFHHVRRGILGEVVVAEAIERNDE